MKSRKSSGSMRIKPRGPPSLVVFKSPPEIQDSTLRTDEHKTCAVWLFVSSGCTKGVGASALDDGATRTAVFGILASQPQSRGILPNPWTGDCYVLRHPRSVLRRSLNLSTHY